MMALIVLRSLAAVSLCAAVLAEEYPFNLTTLSAPDGSINASFVPFGATLTELWVKDSEGAGRDVILGYDDNSRLLTDPAHPVFNAIVGRYANRIKNGTFSIPITKDPQPNATNVFHIPRNDNGGQNTIHGGIIGWDRRNWTVVSHTKTSVTFAHIDAADEGFPGTVHAQVTHAVSNGGVLRTTLKARASEKTPIMATQHIYWNLDAFQGDEGQDILRHTLRIGASAVPEVDGSSIPTGRFRAVAGTPLDFRAPQRIGARFAATPRVCPGGCTGYDNNWVFDRARGGVALCGARSGIRLDVATNQPAAQVYTANFLATPRKRVHGGGGANYTRWSAVAIEQMGYLDAINTPEWGVDQIYYPGRDFEWWATYKFSTLG